VAERCSLGLVAAMTALGTAAFSNTTMQGYADRGLPARPGRHIATYVAALTLQRQARSSGVLQRYGGSRVHTPTYRSSRVGNGQVDSGGGSGCWRDNLDDAVLRLRCVIRDRAGQTESLAMSAMPR
jgi:hypothetical protein